MWYSVQRVKIIYSRVNRFRLRLSHRLELLASGAKLRVVLVDCYIPTTLFVFVFFYFNFVSTPGIADPSHIITIHFVVIQ